ncbi:hypothetical protein LB505_008306 [Fusarium chuoi]|nr:hypothetical protein LB505_008306 [Fusarium chuoi]
MSFTQAPMPSPYTSSNKTILPTRGPPRGHQQRKRDAHERKRTKVDTDSALESLDYWIRFDDEENERTGSYEIDFSKHRVTEEAQQHQDLALAYMQLLLHFRVPTTLTTML